MIHPKLHKQFGWTAFGLLWLVAVVAGLVVVARYDNTAGVRAESRGQWPSESRLSHDASGPTLVMIAHPRCTCTRASLAELAEVMARVERRPRAYVVFVRPEALRASPEASDLWQRAAGIPGVTVVRDERGREAESFGAATSGQVFLYDAGGHLLFSGGTTGSRGHAGDNAGRATLVALLKNERAPQHESPVFGCSLFAPGDRPDIHDHDGHDLHLN